MPEPTPYVPNPDLSLWQMAAVALCEYACGYDKGRGKDDPVYLEVVEHRDVPPDRAHYSSCGDQAWWLLYRLGLRKPWMNRKANGTYAPGMNVADLTGCPVHIVGPTAADYAPSPGDILEIWNAADTHDAHVCISLGLTDPGHLRTANYGAGGMNAAAFPGANIAQSPYQHTDSGWFIGTARRRLQRVIPLAAVVPLLGVAPDLTGIRINGEVIEGLQATWAPAAEDIASA